MPQTEPCAKVISNLCAYVISNRPWRLEIPVDLRALPAAALFEIGALGGKQRPRTKGKPRVFFLRTEFHALAASHAILCLSIIRVSKRRIVVIFHDDARGISLHIIELTAFGGPNENADHDEAEQHHARDQTVDDFHETFSVYARHFR
uniref:Uncharacterized protein n=1 Tax=Candidatus Kentrum sp. TC TaxID=2126339 RepID=A0A451ABE9_9GAMM|nr:MAG: hypothetical protein BECKTC1821F_GA0114240_10939 [Candidatus Kentron sp. TC]